MRVALFLLCAAWLLPLHAETHEPVQEGTMANQQLIRDAMVGVAGWVATKGCEAPERFVPAVLQLPRGEPGSRYWQERWTVTGCGTEYPVIIDFRETGMDSAMWTITP
ncbi:hypothetical protein [Aeromonas enteropelogenes]|uniref:Uncharacterized protein n=1 Tax=Aeromonas enteropelogenes TaxID=29489 RepID=A0A175VID7_AEREN|nr:hypothetical protein [Aeromonas enteropelogenes]KXU80303.1 hypothetical protein LCR_14530 [Aeromonas enteropelogenes]